VFPAIASKPKPMTSFPMSLSRHARAGDRR
jgi:hypothetical protein